MTHLSITFSYGLAPEKQEPIALMSAAVERGASFFDAVQACGLPRPRLL